MRNDADSSPQVFCICTHPTHFLGRCRKRLDSERKCAECKRDHFYPPDPLESRW